MSPKPSRLGKLLPAVILFSMAFILSAAYDRCGGKNGRNTPGEGGPATELRKPGFLLDQLEEVSQDHQEAQSIFSKLRIYTDSDLGRIQASGNLIWIRDSVIWFNARKFGVEAVRALVRTDSVFILNRLEQSYIAEPISFLANSYQVPGDFSLIQELLLGEAWIPENIEWNSTVKDSLHLLSGKRHPYQLEYYLYERPYRLKQLRVVQPQEGRSILMGLSNYEKLKGMGIFPYLRTIEGSSPDTGDLYLSLEFQEITLNEPRNYRFSIPEHYERIR